MLRTTVFLSVLAALSARAADWPMYRADAARSSYTADALPAKLSVLRRAL